MEASSRKVRTRAGKRSDGRSADRRGTARTRLLDAATGVFAERGYHAATVDQIVEAAGVTKGALYAHFASKQALFVGLLEERVDRPVRALMALTETAPADTATAEAVGTGLATLVEEQREPVLLAYEFWALAIRDRAVAGRYRRWLADLTSALARALTARHRATGVPLTMDAELLAAGIIGLAHGLVMRQLAVGTGPGARDMGDMLDLLYDGLVHRAGR